MRKFLFLLCTLLTSGTLLAMGPMGPGDGQGLGFMKRCMGWCPFGVKFGLMRILVIILIIVVIILVIKLIRKKK